MARNLTIALLLSATLALPARADDAEKGLKSIRAADIKKHQTYLASEELEGRQAGSPGGHKAAVYLAQQAALMGLWPGAGKASWFQSFGEEQSAGPLEQANYIQLENKEKVHLGAGIMPHQGARGAWMEAPVVFAGYGIRDPVYDDYSTLNPKGCIVLVLDLGPREKEGKIKATVAQKAEWAAKKGAAALLVALGPLHHPEDKGERPKEFIWPGEKDEPEFTIPVAYISREVAHALTRSVGKELYTVQEEIDRKMKTQTWKTSVPVRLSVAGSGVPQPPSRKNVLALWRGSDPELRKQYVLVGAHYDHLGRGPTGGEVHNGADDNASGSAVILELAEAAVQCSFKRTLVFAWFDEEEKALSGSRHWVQNPTLPLEGCVAMLNLDMVGRNDVKKIVCGLDRDKEGKVKFPLWEAALREGEGRFKATFDWGGQEYLTRGDQWPFMERDIPAAFLHGGVHPDYHKPTDDIEKINFPKQELIAKIAFAVVAKAAGSDALFK